LRLIIHLAEAVFQGIRIAMKALLIACIAAAAVLSTSCNTFIGMGRDLRQLGQGLEDSANNTSKHNANKGTQNSGGAPIY
jgi:predicted small secreted protein